jgi:hypothetical protein
MLRFASSSSHNTQPLSACFIPLPLCRGVQYCRLRLQAAAHKVCRSFSLISATTTVQRGAVVWAKDVTRQSTMWPAEALDPFNLPTGSVITPKHVRGMLLNAHVF